MSLLSHPVPPKRFFIETPLASLRSVSIPEPLQHRLRSVLRQTEGAVIHLFNGQDGLWEGRIADAKARTVRLTQQISLQSTPSPLTLYIGLPKKEAWETVLRQSTELGVSDIIPLKTAFSQVDKLTNPARMQTILAEAAEQSERLTLPTIQSVIAFEHIIDQFHGRHTLWAYERIRGSPTPNQTRPFDTVLVGPEGGFSTTEVAVLSNIKGVVPTSLSPTILRTDTATVAALSLAITSQR